MTTAIAPANPYGYKGHFTKDIYQIIEEHWFPTSTLARENRPDNEIGNVANFDRTMRHVCQGDARITFEKAGYYSKESGLAFDDLWQDMKTAGWILLKEMHVGADEASADTVFVMSKGKPDQWCIYLRKCPDLEIFETFSLECNFDRDGYVIPRSLDKEWLAKYPYTAARIAPNGLGNPRTPDEALLDACIGPRLPQAVNFDQPK